jgi:hypothetical protein
MHKLLPRNGSLKLGHISDLPRHIWLLLAVYFVASGAHFVHNAAYIAYYPNMPTWITSDRVYLAWSVVTAVGITGLVALRLRRHAAAAVFIALYGALGLDGLAHYTLALCSEHTFITNVTIWSEAISGLCLFVASAPLVTERGLHRLPPNDGGLAG